MRLYAITDRSWLEGETLEHQIELLLQGGITILQLREKSLQKEDFIEEAMKIKEKTRAYQVPLIINDSVEVMLASDADGVHIGQSDGDPYEVRKQIGEDKLLGVSVKTLEQAKRAEDAGADYLGVGAVFSTDTKKDAIPVSKEVLQEICQNTDIPVVAIGGITKENIKSLKGTGIAGVAVVSALFAQKDKCLAAKELSSLVDEIVGENK